MACCMADLTPVCLTIANGNSHNSIEFGEICVPTGMSLLRRGTESLHLDSHPVVNQRKCRSTDPKRDGFLLCRLSISRYPILYE